MKITLNQDIVLDKRFSLAQKPILKNGELDFEPNLNGKPYIVFDDNRKSPVGFGLKIGAGNKSYIIQRKVDGKVIKAKVGNVSDFNNINQARDAARILADTMKETGRNPNVIRREKSAAEITLGEAFAHYRSNLQNKPTPAKPNTFKVFDKAVRKLDAWKGIRVRDLTSNKILDRFDEIAVKTRTTAEQTFRWANVAVNFAIDKEEADAHSAMRQPTLTYNPFKVLHTAERYRDKSALRAAYEAKGIRKPLSTNKELGAFLNALWKRRKENRTGCDYFLLMTLWGTRRNEGVDLKWRSLLDANEIKTSSWVCLDTEQVFFFDTKNRSNHTLPLCAGALEILKQRWQENNKQEKSNKWVFLARSKFSKTGHYTDGRSLLKYICEDAEIGLIANHDLRRTFGRVAEELTTYGVVKRLLNHHRNTDSSERYTEVEEGRVRETLQRIELHILMKAPTVYNALLASSNYQPLPE